MGKMSWWFQDSFEWHVIRKPFPLPTSNYPNPPQTVFYSYPFEWIIHCERCLIKIRPLSVNRNDGRFFCWNGKKTLGRNQHFPRIPTKQGLLIGKAYCIVYLCGVAFVSLFQHRSRCRVVCVNCHCQDNGGVWCWFSGYILGATSRCAHKRNNNKQPR